MRIVLSLVKRNLRIYRRDRAGVLLSLLAALMLLLIYALFLGAIQADSLKAKLPSAASEDVGYFVASWVFGGIVMITCVTTGLGALGAYVDDRATGRFKEFRVCPIRRHQLILGYQLSAVVVSFVMTLIVSAVGAAVVKLVYGDIPGWGSFLTALGYVVLFAFAFSAISSFVITFISSRNGFTDSRCRSCNHYIFCHLIPFYTSETDTDNFLGSPVFSWVEWSSDNLVF